MGQPAAAQRVARPAEVDAVRGVTKHTRLVGPAFGSFSTYLSVVLYERRMRAVLTYIGAPARSRAGA